MGAGVSAGNGTRTAAHGKRAATALASGALFGAASLSILGSFARIPVSLAILIFFTFPILTVLFEAPFVRRMPGLAQIGCLIAALAGVGLALDVTHVTLDPLGIVMAVLGAVGIAGGYVLNGLTLKNANPAALSGSMAVAALAVAAGFLLATGDLGVRGVSANGWMAYAGAAVLSGTGFMFQFRGVQLIGSTETAMVMNLEPVLTLLLAHWVLAEPLTATKLAGAALVIAALLTSQWLQRRGLQRRRS